MRQFPHTVQLSQDLEDKGLAVISVSLDDPEEKESVSKFLVSAGAAFDNVISKFGLSPETAEEFEFRGDAPFYQLFDRQGKLRFQFSPDPDELENGETLDMIDQRVQQLLAEG